MQRPQRPYQKEEKRSLQSVFKSHVWRPIVVFTLHLAMTLFLGLTFQLYVDITSLYVADIYYYLFHAFPALLFSSTVCQIWPWVHLKCQAWKSETNVTTPFFFPTRSLREGTILSPFSAQKTRPSSSWWQLSLPHQARNVDFQLSGSSTAINPMQPWN